jgi:hypothetical protein
MTTPHNGMVGTKTYLNIAKLYFAAQQNRVVHVAFWVKARQFADVGITSASGLKID